MKTVPFDERLNRLLNANYHDESSHSEQPHLQHRMFTNRTIKLSRIQAIGFDMDYTLAQYKRSALDQLTMKIALEKLVSDMGYPEAIREIPYKDHFAIRGLVIDTQRGNVLKMDKFRYVSLAYHGLKPIPSAERSQLYNVDRIDFHSGRYRAVDTLFELLETYLLAALVDYYDRENGRDTDYYRLYKDIRGAIDLCHSDGSLKRQIMAEPETFIHEDPMLIQTLHNFKEAGKKLFVVTNSESEYTDFVLSFLFRNAAPFFEGWRSCFEIVCAASRKPLFFKDGTDLKLLEEEPLFFSGGNITFLEERLGVGGDHVLYVGDHIYGDILKSKHTARWRTCIIVPELEFQIRAEIESGPKLKRLMANENRRKALTMELNWRTHQVSELQQFKMAEADEMEPHHLEAIDSEIHSMNRHLEANHRELSKLLYESRQLRRAVSDQFNPYWGRLFKTGGQLSNFAEMVRDYACIYTSSVANFNFFGANQFFEGAVTMMPHEANLYTLADMDFDMSLDSHTVLHGFEREELFEEAPSGSSEEQPALTLEPGNGRSEVGQS